jgi:hypothetical protein
MSIPGVRTSVPLTAPGARPFQRFASAQLPNSLCRSDSGSCPDRGPAAGTLRLVGGVPRSSSMFASTRFSLLRAKQCSGSTSNDLTTGRQGRLGIPHFGLRRQRGSCQNPIHMVLLARRGVAQHGLARLPWEQEVAGSNPVAPILKNLGNTQSATHLVRLLSRCTQIWTQRGYT